MPILTLQGPRDRLYAARRSSSGQSSKRTATRFDTPDSCIVTP
jgi:hypothetical protein